LNNAPVTARAAHVRAGQQLYVVAGIAPSGEFSRSAPTFTSAIQTFRALSQSEADRIQPSRIQFQTAQRGETWESLARRAAGTVSPSGLAIMNGSSPQTPPVAGQRIRVVVGG
jgi:predicted Zn-dependent protease